MYNINIYIHNVCQSILLYECKTKHSPAGSISLLLNHIIVSAFTMASLPETATRDAESNDTDTNEGTPTEFYGDDCFYIRMSHYRNVLSRPGVPFPYLDYEFEEDSAHESDTEKNNNEGYATTSSSSSTATTCNTKADSESSSHDDLHHGNSNNIETSTADDEIDSDDDYDHDHAHNDGNMTFSDDQFSLGEQSTTTGGHSNSDEDENEIGSTSTHEESSNDLHESCTESETDLIRPLRKRRQDDD